MDVVVSESISKLSELVVFVAKTTANFKPELGQLQRTLQRIAPIINDVVKLNQLLDRKSHMFIEELQDALKLVEKCLKIKRRNLLKKFTHSLKLKDVNNKLLRFFQLEVQADQTRDIKQTLVEVNDVKHRMDSLSVDVKQIHQTLSTNSSSFSISSSFSSSSRRDRLGFEFVERGRLGWRVPLCPVGIVAFDDPLNNLKAKLLDPYDLDDDDDETSVVVVAAAGGCGKTTLVTMLCYDSQIQDKFGESIFFVTVSEEPNFKAIVNDLFNPNPLGRPVSFQSDEDAKNKLGNFLHDNVSSPMLLVLDDVWSDSFIDNFPLSIKGCKILVTSRTAFSRFDVFRFDPLSDEDANILFRRSAFVVAKKRPRPTVDGNLVNQMVKRCQKHPLTLTVVGSSLNGRDESAWISMLNTLSQGSSVLDLNEEVRNRLERSFKILDEEFKECFMDFGLFPEDQRIPASVLLDMWVHLYNHDHEGRDTFDKIVGLSFRNLVNLVASGFRKDSGATVNYCDQQFITQHVMLRELAIALSSKLEIPIAKRKRLIINARGEDLPSSVLEVQEPVQARILSISTGDSFSSRWCNMKVPKVEVMVLNLKSKSYSFPRFMKKMQMLKILNVTNCGLYPSYIEKFHFLGHLSNLLRIRLEHIAIYPLSTSILALKNLQKVSFIKCKIGNAFEQCSSDNLKVWPRLVEIEMDYCQDLVGFPGLLCNSVHLKTLSITNCNEMCEITEEIGKLTNLESLSLRSCTKLKKLPESITRLQKLSILDIWDCLSLSELPEEMRKLGGLRTIYMKRWSVPILPGGIVVFEEPLKKLKTKVLAGFDGNVMGINVDRVEGSVVVVTAAGGYGKTTLVTMLCYDSEIQAKYRENIFYVTVPERPNFMVLVNNLLNPNHLSCAAVVQSDEDAKDKLEKFLREQLSGPILLVLDGVQSVLFIKNFEFNIREYKILVTANKMSFPEYDVFHLDPLSHEDAKALFMHSSFSELERIHTPIDEYLVNQIVKHCKKHPRTLSVVGSSLKGKYECVWKSVLKTLSQGEWVLDNKFVTKSLQRTIVQLDEEFEKCLLEFEALDEEFKQCLLDLGLFPSDHKIPACALLDMWMYLYDHGDMGRDTLIKIFQLSYKNLVSITIGEEANAIVNYCDQTFVTQQDLQRELSVHFSGKEPISQRTRLIIDAQGNDLPAPIRQVKEVMSARILSISTGESFSSRWCNMNAPEVEVMVLNIMSQIYTLPHFLEDMQKLKVLNVTSYGLHPTEFVNFQLLGSVTSLTRIRLERVVLPLTCASILGLVNLQKLSFIMCKIGNCFEKLSTDNANVWPRLVEIEIDSCEDLVGFPELFCKSVHLEKLSITNCNKLIQIPEEIGKLTSLETLSLRSCTELEKLPDSISRLEKLSILDISDCFSLRELPENIGMLGSLLMIYMKGCTGIHELPPSVKDLSHPQVLCNEEISYKWREFPNVKLPVVEEDRLLPLTNISD